MRDYIQTSVMIQYNGIDIYKDVELADFGICLDSENFETAAESRFRLNKKKTAEPLTAEEEELI